MKEKEKEKFELSQSLVRRNTEDKKRKAFQRDLLSRQAAPPPPNGQTNIFHRP